MVLSDTSLALSAEPPPAEPWQHELSDGLMFYMTPPDYEAIGYKPSGLYSNGTLVYSVDGYARNNIYFSRDGMSFLYIAWRERAWDDIIWLRDTYPDGILFFYNNGQLIHTFTQKEIRAYTNGNRVRFNSCEVNIDKENDLLIIITKSSFSTADHGWDIFSLDYAYEIVFCLTYGKILSATKLSFILNLTSFDVFYFIYIFVIPTVILLIVGIMLICKKRKTKISAAKP